MSLRCSKYQKNYSTPPEAVSCQTGIPEQVSPPFNSTAPERNQTKGKDGQTKTILLCCMHFTLQYYIQGSQGLQEKHNKYGEEIVASLYENVHSINLVLRHRDKRITLGKKAETKLLYVL